MAEKNKPSQEKKPFFRNITAEKIGVATVGLVALSTLSAGLALGAAAAGGAVIVSKKRKKAKENKKNNSGKK
ncbi:MAG: hypothetical protein QG623_713 [Patescibacteria group bacterium]|nr:hypothetical protein [Patescibacteria group bacterium]